MDWRIKKNMLCECHLVKSSDKNTWGYHCQEKYKSGKMELKDYQKICKRQGMDVDITPKEFKRLKKVWKKNGIKYTVDKETRRIIFI